MAQIYLLQNGQQVGPYEVEALQGWIQAGQIQITEPAWFEGCSDWVTLADVPGIIVPKPVQETKSDNLNKLETSLLYVSRDGQTFGPYNLKQANQFLQAGQLLPSDYAMLEGQTEWKFLPDILNTFKESKVRHSQAQAADLSATQAASIQKTAKKPATRKKSVRIQGLNQQSSVIKVKEKSLVAKLIATVMVFIVSLIIVAGSTAGAYLVAPSQIGPIVRKFGLPIDQWFPGWEVETVEVVEAPPGSLDSIRLSKEQWHHLKASGITILPLEGEDGLQVLSPIDPKLAINDDDLKVLHLIAQHLVILDLTNSEVTDAGLDHLQKFPNLKKLTLENSKKVSSEGVRKLENIVSLEHLNLVGVSLDDSALDSIGKMESLLEVYLFRSGVSEEAVNNLKAARPRMFVNAG